ncbi:transcriptional regulator, MerR family [Catenulispora acidiphila DSM 44928]|uniref:Transcriptional regulator, MerR family n=1 Tax=Catenulispora acidiphila (strain DSM 44928 / JCM 14897 / NBRC 102108 / NRRL B-24433 / ID139908) TaxID=479433 RepID=C7QHA0_CATAD|nr:helix-turn-helix transcriptional regulator [Catenulispora acidiphila]ACU69039.1 transcriptional regulator, MerR family [Catenulispora acidiphila DSM 44928]
MASKNPFLPLTEETPVYVISVAAQLAGMHPQTLRQYDRLGIVCPERTGGGGRRYSARDIDTLREVQRLSQDEGVNLAGIKRIRELEEQVAALSRRVAELEAVTLYPTAKGTVPVAAPIAPPVSPLPPAPPGYRGDLLPALPATFTTALAVWKPQGK